MTYLKPLLSILFFGLVSLAFLQCAKRGTPSGGPEDITPPQIVRTDPENFSTHFKAKKIRLHFDELITLTDVQNQLMISPPLRYPPELKPAGGPAKYVEIVLKDTLKENTTYTLNFGQSIVDNNEGNPNSFLTYVFSTGASIDSLSLSGAVKDAFNRKADPLISVMLYALDSTYTDSTLYKAPPNYITSTGDSLPFFTFKHLRAGQYTLVALNDANKNNRFDPQLDKIGFLQDTITLPTEEVYLLNLFQEVPDYRVTVPSYVAKNRVLFGFQGNCENVHINTLTARHDSVKTRILKDREKDTLHYWFSPVDLDSLMFTVRCEGQEQIDTFTVKTRKLPLDSLTLTPTVIGSLNFEDRFSLLANTPLITIDTTKVGLVRNDSVLAPYRYTLDTVANKIDFEFVKAPNQNYRFSLLPGAVTDLFGMQNDTLNYELFTKSYADYGTLRLTLDGAVRFPLVVQLTDESGAVQREALATTPQRFEFNHLEPGQYTIRIIFDDNGNGQWDTGSYLEKLQPEAIRYYPEPIEVRANWELEQQFILSE